MTSYLNWRTSSNESGYQSIDDYLSDSTQLSNSCRYLSMNSDNLSERSGECSLLVLFQEAAENDKTILWNLNIEPPNTIFEHRVMLYSLIPYTDFIFCSEKDVKELAYVFYDDDTMSTISCGSKLVQTAKVSKIRPRILIIFQENLNDPLLVFNGPSMYEIPSVSNDDILNINRDNYTDHQKKKYIELFITGFLDLLVKIEMQVDIIHNNLEKGKLDRQEYLIPKISLAKQQEEELRNTFRNKKGKLNKNNSINEIIINNDVKQSKSIQSINLSDSLNLRMIENFNNQSYRVVTTSIAVLEYHKQREKIFKSQTYEKIIKERKKEQIKLKESLLVNSNLNITYTIGKSSPEKNIGFMDSVDLGYKLKGEIKPIGYAVCYAKKSIYECVLSGLNSARNF